MLRKNILGLMVCILGVASLSFAGQPDLTLSGAVAAHGTAEVSVYTQPDGNGKAINEAKLEAGGEVDATITVTLVDSGGAPLYLYPFEDMWLATTGGASISLGLQACNGGTVADLSTDINGQTTFSGALFAGGQSDRVGGEKCQVIVNGSALVGSDLDILFNSADMNGDLVVNLSDTTLFVPLYTNGGTTYEYAVDFFFDGSINLSDLVLYAGGLNIGCP